MNKVGELTYYDYWLTKESWLLGLGIRLIADYVKFIRAWERSEDYSQFLTGLIDKINNQIVEDRPEQIFSAIAYNSNGQGTNVDKLSINHFNPERSSVYPKEFLEWVHGKGYPMPYEFKVFIGVEEPADSLNEKQRQRIDKEVCQGIAKTLWGVYPDMTIEEMIDRREIQIYGSGKLHSRDTTLRRWLSEVDPRKVKTGPKKK